MVTASLQHEQSYDPQYEVSFRVTETPRVQRDVSSKARFNTRARYGRGKSSGSTGGTHRRRIKR